MIKGWAYAYIKNILHEKERDMKKRGLKRKIIAGLAALAVFGTALELPMMEQTVYAETSELPAETNATFAKARELEFGASMAGTLSKSDNKRYYKFSLKQACKLQIGIEHNNTYFNSRIVVVIYDDSQTEIYNWSGGYYTSFSLDPVYLTGGNYYMMIEYPEDAGDATRFSFVVNADSMKESFTETQDANNDMASNASVISLKKKYKGVLAQNDDIDYYRLQIPAAGQLTFNMTNSVSDTVKYGFYDQSLNPVYTNTVGSGYKVTQPVQVKRGGYYLAIAKEDVNRGVGSYTFSIDHTQKGQTRPGTDNVTVKQVPLKSVRNPARKKMTVKWSRVSGASGYELWYSTSPNFKKGVVKKKISSSVTSKTYSGLKKKKTYYVKIRAYKNVNGVKKYGKWSRRGAVSIRK